MPVSGADAAKRGIQKPGTLKSIFYFLLFAVAAPGVGLANVLVTLPLAARLFCLAALGFLASRLPLLWSFAITVLPSRASSRGSRH